MHPTKTNIRRMAKRYRDWLCDQQWFNIKKINKDDWLDPLNKIIDKEADTPELIWELVIDHWMETSWSIDGLPNAFRVLYDLIDEYRKLKNVMCTNQ